MKHFDLFIKSLQSNMTYKDYIDHAVFKLNISASTKRSETEPTHAEERKNIINYIVEKFPTKTEEDVIVDLIKHLNIQSQAVNDFMYYHHKNFPRNKAIRIPHGYNRLVKLGLHVFRRIEGNLNVGEDIEIETNALEPYSDISYFNPEKKSWVSFRVADTELFTASRKFEQTCISNGLTLIGGKKSEFEEAVKYIRAFRELNVHLIPITKQHDRIGWTEDKTQFISPRNKKHIINVVDSKHKRALKYGYIQKGIEKDASTNVNNMLEILKNHPLAVAVYAAPFINPIIDGAVLDASCITIDIYGPKGKGKNLLQYAALNPIGASYEKSPLMRSWSGTSGPGIAALVRFHNSHIVCLEESHRARTEVLEDFAYSVFNSTLGEKANTDGTGRDDGRLSSIIISSGERSIAERVKNDGLSRRILPINIIDVLGDMSVDQNKLKKFHTDLGAVLNDLFGIALDPYLEYVLQNAEQVKEDFTNYLKLYAEQNVSAMFDHEKYKTFSTYTACVHLVLDILYDFYDITAVTKQEIEQICKSLQLYCLELCTKQNKNVEALAAIYNYAVTNHHKHFLGNNKNHAQHGAFMKRLVNNVEEECLFFINEELKKILTEMGYVAGNTIEAWKHAGILHSQELNNGNGKIKKSYSIQATIGKKRTSCSVFILSRVQDLLSQFDDIIEDVEFNDETNASGGHQLNNVVVLPR